MKLRKNVNEITVKNLIDNRAYIYLFLSYIKANAIISKATANEAVPIVILKVYATPSHKTASVAPPKPAPIASVIPYAAIIEPRIITAILKIYSKHLPP